MRLLEYIFAVPLLLMITNQSREDVLHAANCVPRRLASTTTGYIVALRNAYIPLRTIIHNPFPLTLHRQIVDYRTQFIVKKKK